MGDVGFALWVVGGVAVVWALAWMEVSRINGLKTIGLAAIEAKKQVEIAKAMAGADCGGAAPGGAGGVDGEG